MTSEELASHSVPAEGLWDAGRFVDGYDRQSLAARHGWKAESAWGSRGWDLGSWPLVTVYLRSAGEELLVCENVEGDASVWSFDTAEDRDAAVDLIAFNHWAWDSAPWVDGMGSAAEMPGALRGPYSRDRADA